MQFKKFPVVCVHELRIDFITFPVQAYQCVLNVEKCKEKRVLCAVGSVDAQADQ